MTTDRLRTQAVTFLRYIVSGVGALVLDFGSYFVLLHAGMWYVAANIVGNVLGFFGAFLLHKYVSFQKRDRMAGHFIRYCLLNVFNLILQTALLWLFVEQLHLDTGAAKVVSWAVSILGNFFLYQLFVYV